jgi:serine/threonine protein kinase
MTQLGCGRAEGAVVERLDRVTISRPTPSDEQRCRPSPLTTRNGRTTVVRTDYGAYGRGPRGERSYAVGEVLLGTSYTVVRELGAGGMGAVLEVADGSGARSVIKILHRWLAGRDDLRRGCLDEACLLERLRHPNIVRVTDYDELTDGTPYLGMERLDGVTVTRARDWGGAMKPSLLHEVMTGLLAALGYIHRQKPSIVHCDVKSENIFIHVPAAGPACVKLIDFGIARTESAGKLDHRFVGTARYAAPEQLRGDGVTVKSDLYSAGLVLYEGLAGRGPFDDVPLVEADGGEEREAVVRGHVSIEAPPVRDFAPWVPESVDRLLRSALAKDPDARPSAEAFASQLVELQFLPEAVGAPTGRRDVRTLADLVASVGASRLRVCGASG